METPTYAMHFPQKHMNSFNSFGFFSTCRFFRHPTLKTQNCMVDDTKDWHCGMFDQGKALGSNQHFVLLIVKR